VIEKVMNHELDILIGTQMIAKGHHFPKLEFVGIIDADLGLEGGDMRAMERTYQILHQVAGRAGREDKLGKVLVQTYMPDNSAIKALTADDGAAFVANEMKQRRLFGMPPYTRLATITLSGKLEKQVKNAIAELARIAPNAAGVDVMGPAPAPMSFLRGQYRYRIILKTPSGFNIQHYIDAWLKRIKLSSALTLRVDIDPYSFV
jgi:primosomal protein N' (replication factor Y)